LPFIFPLVDPFEDGKAGFFGVGEGNGAAGVETGDDFADGFSAGGTDFQLRGREGTAQGEPAAADCAPALAEFIFVNWHRLFKLRYTISRFVANRMQTEVEFEVSDGSVSLGSNPYFRGSRGLKNYLIRFE